MDPNPIKVVLTRIKHTPNGVLGAITINGKEICKTVELPWKDNQPKVSCIPVGVYACIPHDSPKHPNVWEISNVPNRDNILIHNANVPAELLGCVAVGLNYGVFDGIQGVAHSRDAMTLLRQSLPHNFTLTIREISAIIPSMPTN